MPYAEYLLRYDLHVRKSFRYRLFPTPAQERTLVQTLRECRFLYNHLLAERKEAFEQAGKSPSLYSQQSRFPELKEANPALREVHSQILQNVAVRIDLAFKAFFRRCKTGEKLSYKAEWAGRKLVKVNPAYTSQDCSCCGYRQVMPLSVRQYDCPSCGWSLDRDHNAARNILRVGLHSQRGNPREAHVL